MGKKLYARGIRQEVFGEVLVVRLVTVEDRSFRKIEFESAQMLGVTIAAGRKGNFDRIAFSSSHHVDLQSIEISALTAVISPIGVVSGRFGVDLAPVNSDVIADLDWAAINEENIFGTGHLVHLAEPFEERFQDRVEGMEPPVEAASAESSSKVGRAFEQVLGSLEIAAEEASGHDRGGHHLRIGDPSLRTFLMAAGSEPIVGKAVHGNDSGVHKTGDLRERN